MKIVLTDCDTVVSKNDLDLSPLERFGEVTYYGETAPSLTASRIADADIVIVNKTVIEKPEIDAAKNLKLIALFSNSINFFNPLAYVAVSRLEKEIELSCDEAVLKDATPEERLAYGSFMLEIIKQRKSSETPLTTSYNPRIGTLKSRFINIIDDKVRRRGKTIIVSVLVMCLFASSILGCKMITKFAMGNLFIKGDTISLLSENIEFSTNIELLKSLL